MKMVSIEVYALKSTRKNSKCEVKRFMTFPGSKNGKKQFTVYDKTDLQEWLQWQIENNGYKYFQLVVSDGTETLSNGETLWKCMHGFIEKPYNSEYTVCELTFKFMDLYNVYMKNLKSE